MAASSRKTRQRVLYDDTRIDLHHLRPWAGGSYSRIVATAVSTGWQREHRTSRSTSEMPPFEQKPRHPEPFGERQLLSRQQRAS